jgi:hypothetical protein
MRTGGHRPVSGRIFAGVMKAHATKGGRRTSSFFLNAFQELDTASIQVCQKEFRYILRMRGRDTYSKFNWHPLTGSDHMKKK